MRVTRKGIAVVGIAKRTCRFYLRVQNDTFTTSREGEILAGTSIVLDNEFRVFRGLLQITKPGHLVLQRFGCCTYT